MVSWVVNLSPYLRAAMILALLLAAFAPQNYRAQETAAPRADPRSVLTFGEKLKIRGIPNAGKVSDRLYRGAQPREVGYQQLKNLGVGIVVDLRNTGPKAPERGTVEALGMRYVRIPTSAFLWSE